MDKNMINIDDLVRQRLADAEEQERPGAWMRMKDVLDQEMPANVPAKTNWRRMFGYIAAVAILAAVSVGGYEMTHSFNNDGGASSDSADNTASSTNSIPNGIAGTALRELPTSDNSITEDAAEQNTSSPVSGIADVVSKMGDDANTTSANNTIVDAVAMAPNNNGLGTLNARPSEMNSGNTSSGGSTPNNSSAVNNSTSGSTQQNLSDVSIANNSDDGPLVNKSTSPDNKGQNRTRDFLAYLSTGGLVIHNVEIPATKLEKVSYQPYRRIVMKESYDENGALKLDTIYNGMDEMKVTEETNSSNELVAVNEKAQSTANNNLAPNASYNESNQEGNMVALTDKKVSSKRSKNFNSNRFEEVVQNAKYRMGKIKVYPGLVGGLNGSSISKDVYGVNLGLACNIAMDERWTILTEAKLLYRFNSSKNNVRNDFTQNVEVENHNGTQIATYDSIEHYYNFSNYASVELPIALSYNFRNSKLSVFGGGNLMYNFKVGSIAEIENIHLVEVPYQSTNTNIYDKEQDKKVLLSDFGNTMSAGYLLGVGYQATPAVRLDLRCSQSFWNNASTPGQKLMFKDLYGQPQLQFNVMYRFRSNRPYNKIK